MFTSRPPARFRVTYTINGRAYWFTIPGESAAKLWREWKRPGAILMSVVEVDDNMLDTQ